MESRPRSKRASKRGQASKENDVDPDLVDFQSVKKRFKQGHVTSREISISHCAIEIFPRKSHDLQGNIVDIALAVPLKIVLAMVQLVLHRRNQYACHFPLHVCHHVMHSHKH